MPAPFTAAARTLAAAACSVALNAAGQAPAASDAPLRQPPADPVWSAIYRADLDSLRAFI